MVLKFEKKRISADKRIKLKNLKLLFKKDLHYNGWFGYVYDVSLSLNGKVIDIKDTIFSDGKIIAPDGWKVGNKIVFNLEQYGAENITYIPKENGKNISIVFKDNERFEVVTD